MSDKQNASHSLHREIEAARVLLANYRDVLEDDQQATADAVEGQTNLNEAIQHGVVRLAEIEARRAGLAALIAKLKSRDERFEQQQTNLRTAMHTAMELAQRKTVETALATLSRAPSPPKVIVTKEEDIPAEFWVRGEPKLDKKTLLAALKALPKEERIPGAELSNGGEVLKISWS